MRLGCVAHVRYTNSFITCLLACGFVRLSERLWDSVRDVFEAIMGHPFIVGLSSGALEEAKFRHYIVQDYIYLGEYRRVLSLVAAKAELEEHALLFLSVAAGIRAAEEALHERLLAGWGLRPEDVRGVGAPSPTNLLYTSYLFQAAVFGSFAEAVAAVLPCPWVYMEVGRRLAVRGSPNPLYRGWIEKYGGSEYEAKVRGLIDLLDSLAPSEAEEERMAKHFRLATIFEYMFWDSSYRLEGFPFPLGGRRAR